MISNLADLHAYVAMENPEIIYLTEREFCNVTNDPAILLIVHQDARSPRFQRFMGRPILMKPPK